MHPRRRITRLLALTASLVSASIASVSAQPADLGFSNPTRFMPQSGEALYAAVCQGCHMPGSIGAMGAGAYPPLADNANLASVDYLESVLFTGLRAMPPVGRMMSDAQFADVINYVRTHFGNQYDDAISAADVKAAR